MFTSGATESDNLALFGVIAKALDEGEPAHLITTAIEHHAVLHAAEALERRGAAVTYLPVSNEGVVSPADVRRALRPETRLISVMLANNETGALQPVGEIAQIAAEAGVALHTDAVQAIGKVTVNVKPWGPTCSRYPGTSCMGRRGWVPCGCVAAHACSRCSTGERTSGSVEPELKTSRASWAWARRFG